MIFQFVPVGRSGALFVGAYRILDEWVFPADPRQHILHDPAFGENDDHEHLRYNLERIPEFENLVGRILIDWGSGTRAWSQWPARQDKPIIELRSQQQDDPFPGFSKFSSAVDEIEFLPNSWQGALGSVAGVYLLVCPTTGEQYVGSAYGEEGFMGRWRAYAMNGHGGNQLLLNRERSNFSVSILEVASPDMSARDIIERESAWKNKLGSRSHANAMLTPRAATACWALSRLKDGLVTFLRGLLSPAHFASRCLHTSASTAHSQLATASSRK